MVLNAFLPHLTATVLTRTYAPGVVTGLLLNVPICLSLLSRALREEQLQLRRLARVTVVFVPLLLASLPLLFIVGRWIEGALA